MPKFRATLTYRIELTCVVTVAAKDEDAAGEKVQALIQDGKLGHPATPDRIIEDCKAKMDQDDRWELTDDQIDVESIEEE